MDISIEKMAEKLKEHKEYKIIYHIRPDGDCIGSTHALALALQSIGAKCEVVGQDPIPSIHNYMTNKVIYDKPENPLYILVDTASLERAGSFKNEHITFCIDHHSSNSVASDYRYVEPDCGACSEIIYKLIKAMNITITKQIAELLYTAIITDTMCFRTYDTSAQTLEIATELAKTGIDICYIGRLHTFIKSPQRMKVENILLDSFHYTCDNKVLTGIITLDDLKTADILDSDLEGINSFAEQISNVRISVTIREQPNGITRCSVRTNGNISANEICAVKGGGGHLHAACCNLQCTPDKARDIMEELCCKFLKESEKT